MSPGSSERDLEGRVGIVTGGGSGLGRAAAEAAVAAGATVVVADIDEAAGREAAGVLGDRAVFVAVDIADPDSAEAMVAETMTRFGRLDFAFNNAGVDSAGWDAADIPVAEWGRVIGVNLTGCWNCLRAEVPAMLETGAGSIVSTSSALGLVGIARQAAYVAAKHGVVGLTRAAAIEYGARGIRVNAICPGVIETPLFHSAAEADPELRPLVERMHPIGRLGEAREIGDALVWLASDRSSFVTGHALSVDGGFVVH